MVYLIWSILNLTLWLYFLYLLAGLVFRGRRIFQGRLRSFSILLVIIGVVQILAANDKDQASHNSVTFTEKYNPPNSSESHRINLDDYTSFSIDLWIKYSVEQDTLVPIECSSYLTGFVAGFDWELYGAVVDEFRKGDKGRYQISGTLIWSLFGIEVYRQDKDFSGMLDGQNT